MSAGAWEPEKNVTLSNIEQQPSQLSVKGRQLDLTDRHKDRILYDIENMPTKAKALDSKYPNWSKNHPSFWQKLSLSVFTFSG
jgi:hypothetical protein